MKHSAMKKNIIFKINRKEFIKLIFDDCQESILYEEHALEFFLKNDRVFIIGHDTILEFAEKIHLLMQVAVANKLLLHPSISNLGLMSNQHTYLLWNSDEDLPKSFVDIDSEDGIWWVGSQYKLSGYKNRTAWLYNDEYGNIIFEITPWYNSLKNGKHEAMSFQKWSENYKSILKRVIAPDIAQQWIQQAKELIELIYENGR
jgi:hypothetical protein